MTKDLAVRTAWLEFFARQTPIVKEHLVGNRSCIEGEFPSYTHPFKEGNTDFLYRFDSELNPDSIHFDEKAFSELKNVLLTSNSFQMKVEPDKIIISHTLNGYQQAASKTAQYPPEVALQYNLEQLAVEGGEALGKHAKMLRKGGSLDNSLREAIMLEVGDVLWHVSQAARALGYSLEEVAQRNLAKLASRVERGVIQGDGDNR